MTRAVGGISKLLVAAPVPFGSGGLGRAAAEFTAGAEAVGCEVDYVGPPPPGPAAQIASSRAFRRLFGMGVSRSLGARALRGSIPGDGWDLVYAVSGSVPVELPGGIKVVHQANRYPRLEWEALHRAERETGGRGDMSGIERRRREHELAEADLVHVTSEAVRDEFLDAGFAPEKLVHSYLGVDLDRYSPIEKGERLRVAFIGPLSMRKGVDVASEVARRLDGDAVVEAVGGPTCPWSRRIAESAPFQAGESAAAALGRAHALILPSRADGFSYVVLEALASGAVPIVTPAVGAAEVVRRLDPRLVIEQADFADAAPELIRSLDLRELGARGRELANEFDCRRTAPAMARAVLERARTQAGAA